MRASRIALVSLLALALPVLAARAGDEDRKIDATQVKVGQRYTFKLVANNQSVWEVTAKTDDEVTYRIHMTIAGKELPAGEPQRFHLKPVKSKKDTSKKVGEEKLKVSGIEFACTIFETETGGQTVKVWRANAFPEVVKTQMGKDVTQELVDIK
jgi:hypothetical protein